MQKVFPCEEPAGEETKKEILQNERLNFLEYLQKVVYSVILVHDMEESIWNF